MKILRRIANCILALVMLTGIGVLVCAFNPSLTDKLATKLEAAEQDGSYSVEISPIGGDENNATTENGTNGSTSNEKDSSTNGTNGNGISTEYRVPDKTNVSSPDAVKGKNGYEPVKENGEKIADADAEALKDKLQTGDIGETLSFDSTFYPYYHMLNQNSQAIYRQIFSNAMNLTKSFAPAVNVNLDEVRNAFEAVYNDHPEIFWLQTAYSCKYLQSGECIEITLQYHSEVGDLKEARAKFAASLQEILSGASALTTDQEKEKYVHDALMAKVKYDASAPMGQSAYSALVNGKSVCAGYARAFQFLMIVQGIPTYYCTGYSGEDHAWNIIRVDGDYYNVDVTWDDTDPSTYDYYNKTDAEYAKTHVRKSLSVKLPACNGAKNGSNVQNNNQGNADNSGTNEGAGSGKDNLAYIDTDDLINPNPQKPLTVPSNTPSNTDKDKVENPTEEKQSGLDKAGLKKEEVMGDLKAYYADCLKQMTKVGTGYQQFTNAVPQSLWASIEKAYSDESYRKGYVDEALKKLKVENFAIQLQVEDLSGGYYRLYHNISTW